MHSSEGDGGGLLILTVRNNKQTGRQIGGNRGRKISRVNQEREFGERARQRESRTNTEINIATKRVKNSYFILQAIYFSLSLFLRHSFSISQSSLQAYRIQLTMPVQSIKNFFGHAMSDLLLIERQSLRLLICQWRPHYSMLQIIDCNLKLEVFGLNKKLSRSIIFIL